MNDQNQTQQQNQVNAPQYQQPQQQAPVQQQTGSPKKQLTDAQVNRALNVLKPMFIDDAKKMVDFLEQQNDPNWWHVRPKFVMCAKSFNKHQREEYYKKHPEKRPEYIQEQEARQTQQAPVQENRPPEITQYQMPPEQQQTPPQHSGGIKR